MICDPCRLAGVYNFEANVTETSDFGRKVAAAHAKGKHRECGAPTTCPCQHTVGRVLARG